MKALDVLLLSAFTFAVAYAAMTVNGTPSIIAASILAALLLSGADSSDLTHRHLAGSRSTTQVDRDIVFLRRQLGLWWAFATAILILTAVIAIYAVTAISFRGFPGGWMNNGLIGWQREGYVLGIALGLSLLYAITVIAGCINPLRETLCVLRREWDLSWHAEQARNATVAKPDWLADNQGDWGCPRAAESRRKDRERRLYGDCD